MAKKNIIGGINWDLSAFMANEAIAKRVKTIHDTAIREAATIAANLQPNPDKIFSFANYPQTKSQVEKVFNSLANKMTANIKQGNTDAFAIAHAKNEELLDYLSQKTKVSRKTLEKRYDFGARNQEGLSAFQTRKDNGLGLSDRVWKISNNARREIEFGIDLGLEEGMDASKLSRKVRENLVDPNNLFRRVRDKHGNLKLSQSAKEFSPGQGVYRSSYKNAMRLTRTEINTAYRTADHDRWSSLDFIVGIEVKLSGSANPCPVCQSLAGKYPKTFKFIGWHPQCRCFAVPILPTADEYDELELKLLNEEDTSLFESVNSVKSVPKGMTDWIDANKDRAKNWKSMPYFVRDNFEEGVVAKGFKFKVEKPNKTVKAIKEPVTKIAKVDKVDVGLENEKDTEAKLGTVKGKEMSFEEANEQKGNPLYRTEHGYSINCQSCVVANELRRRGFNVSALKNNGKKGNIPNELSRQTEKAWIDPKTGQMPVKQKAGGLKGFSPTGRVKTKTIAELEREFGALISETGRYHIDWGWKRSRSGHIITLEKLANGNVRLYDPQTGKRVIWAELKKQVRLSTGLRVLRVDNLLINTDIIAGVVTK